MKLKRVVRHLEEWQAGLSAAKRKSRCLEAVRKACFKENLHLPLSEHDYEGKLAIDNFRTLRANPHKWAWQQVSPLPKNKPSLVYFGKCGILADGRVAGHIAIYDPATGKHYANSTYRMNNYWAARLLGAFIPEDEA